MPVVTPETIPRVSAQAGVASGRRASSRSRQVDLRPRDLRHECLLELLLRVVGAVAQYRREALVALHVAAGVDDLGVLHRPRPRRLEAEAAVAGTLAVEYERLGLDMTRAKTAT